jgi:hypothetical protein
LVSVLLVKRTGASGSSLINSQLLEKAQDKVVNLSKKIRLQQFFLLIEQKPNNNSKESVELEI